MRVLSFTLPLRHAPAVCKMSQLSALSSSWPSHTHRFNNSERLMFSRNVEPSCVSLETAFAPCLIHEHLLLLGEFLGGQLKEITGPPWWPKKSKHTIKLYVPIRYIMQDSITGKLSCHHDPTDTSRKAIKQKHYLSRLHTRGNHSSYL